MRQDAGFTLIESVIIIVVILVLSISAVAAINNAMRAIQLRAAADKLASDLRYTKNLADSYRGWFGVSFDVSPLNRYTIYSTTGTLDATIENPAKLGANFVVEVDADFGVNISAVNIAGGNKIEFNPIGAPYNDKLGLAITAEGVITLEKDASTATVRIAPNTGRVYIP